MSFEKLNLIKPIQKALDEAGYTIPTPIQQRAIPVILERKDILGSAQTGTGKTAAYAVPILQILYSEKPAGKEKRPITALVLTPTRELAVQVGENFDAYGKHTGLRNVVVYGGVPQQRQTDKLRKGVDILIATPGRLLDLMNQKYINLHNIKVLVLDEADRMLDMGFINDIKKIISSVPGKRQTLFFSATLPSSIVKLAGSILTDPVKVEVIPEKADIDSIKQGIYYVAKQNKKDLLIHLLQDKAISSALVFTRTKHGADKVEKFLNSAKIHAEAIHGNKSQGARQRALNNFKAKKTRVLVATDIAARGIDVEELSHVINYEMPDQSENYVHRIGRTGRAGLTGVAISFCDSEEKMYLRDINRIIAEPIPVIHDNPFPVDPHTIENMSKAPGKHRSNQVRQSGERRSPEDGNKNKKRWFDKKRSGGSNDKRRTSSTGEDKRSSNSTSEDKRFNNSASKEKRFSNGPSKDKRSSSGSFENKGSQGKSKSYGRNKSKAN
jgi:ATP-dependent RNA helicase RhlE